MYQKSNQSECRLQKPNCKSEAGKFDTISEFSLVGTQQLYLKKRIGKKILNIHRAYWDLTIGIYGIQFFSSTVMFFVYELSPFELLIIWTRKITYDYLNWKNHLLYYKKLIQMKWLLKNDKFFICIYLYVTSWSARRCPWKRKWNDRSGKRFEKDSHPYTSLLMMKFG